MIESYAVVSVDITVGFFLRNRFGRGVYGVEVLDFWVKWEDGLCFERWALRLNLVEVTTSSFFLLLLAYAEGTED